MGYKKISVSEIHNIIPLPHGSYRLISCVYSKLKHFFIIIS